MVACSTAGTNVTLDPQYKTAQKFSSFTIYVSLY